MSSSVTLSAATRQNLLSLQDTASLLSTTQNRLSTGKKVNSALDNPTNFFTSQSLTARSSDLSGLLDGISNSIQTIQAANQGITSIQKLLDSAKSTAQQALADKSGGTSSSISGGRTAQAATVSGNAFSTAVDKTQDFSALNNDGSIDISLDGGTTKTTIRLDSSTLQSAGGDLTKLSANDIVTAINGQIAGSSALKGKVAASLTPDGRLTLTTTGAGADQKISVTGSAGSTIDIGFGKAAGATAASVTGITKTGATADKTNMAVAGTSIDLLVSDGNKTVNVKVDKDTVYDTAGNKVGNGSAVSSDIIKAAIQKQLTDAGSTIKVDFTNNIDTATPANSTSKITFTTQEVGPDASISVVDKLGGVDLGLVSAQAAPTATMSTFASGTTANKSTYGTLPADIDLSDSKAVRFTVSDTVTTKTISLDKNSLDAGGSPLGSSPPNAKLLEAINAQLGASSSFTAIDDAGSLAFQAKDNTVDHNIALSNVVSTADIGLGLASNTGVLNRLGAGTSSTGLSAAGADATDGSSKASIAGSATTLLTTSPGNVTFAAGDDASFNIKLGSGQTKRISLNSTDVGGAGVKTQGAVLKAINDQIQADTGLADKVKASFVNNQLVISTTAAGSDQKLTVQAAQVASGSGSQLDIGFGLKSASATALTGAGTDVGGGSGVSSTRAALAKQFNTLLTQITQQAQDSGYNGVNLLYRTSGNAADNTLHVAFNEKSTSALDIQGVKFDAAGLGLNAVTGDFQSDDDISTAISALGTATAALRTQSSTFGSNLSVVQNRQDFSKNLITILDTGSSNLTSADLNEEAANSQALSTRNSLAISALSLANQAQQGILQLLR